MQVATVSVWAALLLAAPGDDATIQGHLKELHKGNAQAAEALVKLGDKAAPALVDFLQKVDPSDAGPGWVVADVLARIGAPAVPALRKGLKTNTPVFALGALKKIGPAAKDALPELINLLKQGPPQLPQMMPAYALTVEVIGQVGPDAREAAPLLVKQLSATNPAVVHVVVALGRLGPAAMDAVPTLTELAEKGPASVRPHAKESLRQIKN